MGGCKCKTKRVGCGEMLGELYDTMPGIVYLDRITTCVFDLYIPTMIQEITGQFINLVIWALFDYCMSIIKKYSGYLAIQ